MSQPSFWLKVSKKYVIENFESLLDYISRYNYLPQEAGQTDFELSVQCLAETVADLAEECRQTKYWERPELVVDTETAVRLMAASVLANKKMGIDDHDGILNLIELLLTTRQQLAPNVARSLLSLSISCMCRCPIESFGFSFTSISKSNFIQGVFPSLLAATKVGTHGERRVEFEGKGCLEISAEGIVAAPMNFDAFHRLKLKPTLDGVEGIKIVEHDEKRPFEIDEMLEYYGRLSAKLERVVPSPVKSLPEYSVGDRMLAEVISVNGLHSVMRTVSNDFKILEGRLYIPPKFAYYIPRESFASQLEVGDIFLVERIDRGDEYTFTLSNEDLPDVFADYLNDVIGEKVWAVFVSHFRNGVGTRWLTEDGFMVNVGWSVPEGINVSEDASEKVTLTVRELTTDNTGKPILNATFGEDRDNEVEDCDVMQFKNKAFENFCAAYLDWSKPTVLPVKKQEPQAERIGRSALVIAGRLLETMADDPNLSTFSRLEHLTLSMTLLKMTHCDDGDVYVRHKLDYQRAIAEFASGASPISLKLQRPETLKCVDEALLRDLVIERLRSYKELEISHVNNAEKHLCRTKYLDEETPEVIRQLVDASNILIDKIDSAEIQRIKKSIAMRLGVDDCYHNSYDGLPYYGDETETLELKQSCTLPPLNRRTTSFMNNLEVQKYAILKGVCAFLNSSHGGDLLVGVADSGYGVGLKEDIDRLYSARVISEPTPDRLRIYLKNAIDRAFTTVDESMSGSAITADCVSCNIENPRDNIEVLRINIKPFPWDVVKFRNPEGCRPEGVFDVYNRTSGASTPMSTDGIRAIKLRKIAELGSENAKLLPIMEAIDEHRCVMLRGYASSSGKSDRKIEPHRMLFDLKAVQAFDLKSRSMKLFKLHRVAAVERTPDRWKNESLHRDFDVDMFGMMQSDGSAGEQVKIKITDYALSLLREEFPGVPSKTVIKPNDDADKERFAWLLTTQIYNPAGIGRFILGLCSEIKVVEGPMLKEYLNL